MHSVEHPLIAVNGLLQPGDKPRLSVPVAYLDSILKAGGTPLVLSPIGAPGDIERALEHVDGLLLTGGDDFCMERLGLGATHPAADPTPAAKQDFDVELARQALELELPVLGICYGMQLLVLVEGGNLHQHLPEDFPGGREHRHGALHDVAIEPGTKLRRLLGIERVETVSRHHQAVSEVGPRWRVAGRDDEGLIEAVEREGHPFAIGVQWHPELSPEGSPNDRLFQGLVGAAGSRAARREFQPQ